MLTYQTTMTAVETFFKVDPTGLATPGMRSMPIEIRNAGRRELALFLDFLGASKLAEVGTELGLYAEELCASNTNLQRLYCVDPYLAYADYRDYANQAQLDGMMRTAQERLQSYPATFIRKPSVDAARDFTDGELDFVYIDGNHSLPYVVADLHAWVPKVRSGGIIAGHDFVRRMPYRRDGTPTNFGMHVVEAVEAWTSSYQVYPWFVLGSKNADPGEIRDKPRSFFWVKE